MSKGLVVRYRDVIRYGAKIRLFSGEHGRVVGHLVQIQGHEKRENIKVRSKPKFVSIPEVYEVIHRLFDRHGNCIAIRQDIDTPLLSTGKGHFRKIERRVGIGQNKK
jgi:hypothetical protein